MAKRQRIEKVDKAPYTTIYNSIAGPQVQLMTWDEECGCHTPWMTGHNGYGKFTREACIKEAKDWAQAEGIEYKGPEV